VLNKRKNDSNTRTQQGEECPVESVQDQPRSHRSLRIDELRTTHRAVRSSRAAAGNVAMIRTPQVHASSIADHESRPNRCKKGNH
jgi:hypothetical protein